ncbi:MAG: adenylate/guanylate cyclase domain-containing protein [Caldilineae bacterium]|nr:adenylate/guanylate cyclase domain-containing protein [Caldilineae bacterium]
MNAKTWNKPNQPNCPIETARQLAAQPATSPKHLMEELTFMVTDIRNSTADWAIRPAETYRALVAHDRIMVAAVESRGGRVFNIVGDAVLAAFERSTDALAAALAAQHALRVRDQRVAEGELQLADRVCIGLHTGTVYRLGDDYRGLELCRVARIVHEGKGGEILASSRVAAQLREQLPEGCRLRDRGYAYLQGIRGAERLFRVEADPLVAYAAPAAPLPGPWGLRLRRLAIQGLALASLLMVEPVSATGPDHDPVDPPPPSATACPMETPEPWRFDPVPPLQGERRSEPDGGVDAERVGPMSGTRDG